MFHTFSSLLGGRLPMAAEREGPANAYSNGNYLSLFPTKYGFTNYYLCFDKV